MSKDRDKGHDHAGHGHHAHEEHGHGDHEGHGHDAHEEHGREGHRHDAHEAHGHEHHDHDAHDQHEHEGHDHHAHEEHGHDEHEGHDHGHHGHGHGHHDHDHDHSHDLRGASKRSLGISLALIGGFMFVEIIGAVVSGSLALLADAGHMATDAGAIVLALVAMWLANRPASVGSTFGYHRTEVLAALLNTLSLWLIAGWIFFEAYNRFWDVPEIEGGVLFGVGAVGLLVNIIAAWILHSAAGESMNVEGAFWHVMADLLGSVGVILSAVLVLAFEWYIADPIISIVIGLLILWSSWSLFMRLFRVLLEGTPDNVDIYRVCSDMEDVEGVTLVHDVHAWTITSGYNAFTAHVLIDPSHQGSVDDMLTRLRGIARGFGLTHITLQLERTVGDCKEETHHVEHLEARSAA